MAKKPGNTLKTARQITVTNLPTSFKDSLNRRNKADFYSFQLTRSSNFNLTVTGLKANANVALLNQSGKPIIKSIRPKKQNESLSLTLNPATYYIQVSLKDNAKTKYKLEIAGTPSDTDPITDTVTDPTSNSKFQRLWLKQFGTASVDRALAVATGSNQDIYIAGSTQGALQGNNLGVLDAYVAKYDSSGNSQWIRQIGTAQIDELADITIDAANNPYAVGTTLIPTKVLPPIFSNAYVVKYGNDGSLLFQQSFDGSNRNDELGLGTALSNDGSLYVVGQVTSLNWATFTVNIDSFIAKYNSSGTLISQSLIDLTNQGTATSVTVDGQGNIYVTGITNASARTDPATLVTTLTEGDIFVTKYDSNGQSLWFKTIETNETDIPGKVLVDASGNVYVAGSTSGSLPGNTNKGDIDAFLAKYSNDGSLQWIKQFGTSGKDTAESIALDSSGRIYAVGTTGGSLFGDAILGGSDAWIALFDNSGNRITNTQFGTVKDDRLLDIALDKTGNLVLVGETEGDLDGANRGSVDAWVAKYSPVIS